MRYLWLGLLLFFVAGCIPYSDNPLTDPSPQNVDAKILGTWFWQEKGETGFLHIGFDDEKKLLRVVMVDVREDGRMNVSELTGHTSLLGDKTYLNLKWIRPADEAVPGYLLYKYEVTDRKFGLAILDSSVIDKAIKDKSLKGEPPADKESTATHITAEQKELQSFFVQHDKELFEEMSFLTKLELPEKSVEVPAKTVEPAKP